MHALIKSVSPSFRRAGIQFTAAGHRVDLAALTDAQLQAIYGEPRLVVTLIEVPKDQGKAPGENQQGAASLGSIPEAGTGDDGAAVTSSPAGASAPAGADAAPAAKPARAPKAAKPKA